MITRGCNKISGRTLVYKSKHDGSLNAACHSVMMECNDPDQEWDKLKALVASLDVAVWMFDSTEDAIRFSPEVHFMGVD